MNSSNKGRFNRDRLASVTGLAVLLVVPAVADPVIEVTHKSDGRYRLTIEVDEAMGVAEGRRLLLPTAVRFSLPTRHGVRLSLNERLVRQPPKGLLIVVVRHHAGL